MAWHRKGGIGLSNDEGGGLPEGMASLVETATITHADASSIAWRFFR